MNCKFFCVPGRLLRTLISRLKGSSKCLIVMHSTPKCHDQPRLCAASMSISTALTHGECCWFTFEAYPVSSLQLNCKLNKIGKARQKHSKQTAGGIVRMAEDTPKWSRPASQRRQAHEGTRRLRRPSLQSTRCPSLADHSAMPANCSKSPTDAETNAWKWHKRLYQQSKSTCIWQMEEIQLLHLSQAQENQRPAPRGAGAHPLHPHQASASIGTLTYRVGSHSDSQRRTMRSH